MDTKSEQQLKGGSANKAVDRSSEAMALLRNMIDQMNERIEAVELAAKIKAEKGK